MTPLHRLARRMWPLVDWRRAAVLEARHRGAAAMLDESMRRTQAFLALPYRLGDSDGTWSREVGDVPRNVEPSAPTVTLRLSGHRIHVYEMEPGIWTDGIGNIYRSGRDYVVGAGGREVTLRRREPSDGEAVEPRTITVDRDVLMRRAREASDAGADYLPPWTGEGL